MLIWPFSKRAKPPPFTINRNFYLTVLGAAGPLPPLLQLINPDGSNGAVRGFGAPLSAGASRDMLNEPLSRIAYALTTQDKKTVLQMDVFRRSDVRQFRLPQNPTELEDAGLTGEKLRKAETAGHLINLAFRGYSPDVYESVRFMLDIATRLGNLTDAVVADPLAECYRLPEEFSVSPRMDPRIDFREVASVKAIRLQDGIWVSTRGMCKFNLAEYEMYGISDGLANTAARMLMAAGQQTLLGMPLRSGETAFALQSPLAVLVGTRQRHIWGDRPTLELQDPGRTGAELGVKAWHDQGN